jgi:polysaccharide deacetylase 2 family uncharacterized protein YibQ
VPALVFAVLAAACGKPETPLPAAEIHAITRELAAAASSAVPPGSAVCSSVRTADAGPTSQNQLNIALHVDSDDAGGPAAIARVLQALGRVATRHGLTEDPLESRGGILFQYSHAGRATHTVHLRVSAAVALPGSCDVAEAGGEPARVAIILDDLGNDLAAAKAVFALRYPLTLSVLPGRPHSAEIAEEARRRGYQVLLHLPMESLGNHQAESRELRAGMSGGEVSALVNQFLASVPQAVGVNNHQGSESTADEVLMSTLMPVLRDHHLFYIDSRTTTATVAYNVARQAGVPTAFRNVPFLDDVPEVSAVRKQWLLAVRESREKGEAVAIGHPHPATLQALGEVLPQLKEEGVQLVFASDLVH